MSKSFQNDAQTKLSKLGNSHVIRIPAEMIAQLGWENNERISITIEEKALVLRATSNRPTNIHELFKDWRDDGQRDFEPDWGERQGHELKW